MNGLRIWWHENGNKKIYEIPYKNDIQHGAKIYFNY